MLMYFPKLYPDELLYSWFARYHLHSGNISPKVTMKELFGSISHTAVPDLPTRLQAVYDRLAHFNIPSIDELIKEHTFYRYYAPFLQEEKRKNIYDAMVSGQNTGRIHTEIGLMPSTVKEMPYFRYCPKCVEEDIKNLGETYWRLNHQLPSVHICLNHDEILRFSDVPFRSTNKHMFVPATEETCPPIEVTDHYNEHTLSILRTMADETKKLMSEDYCFTWSGLNKAYKYLLQINGYANFNGTVNQQKLASQFQSFYGNQLLDIMQSKIDPYSDWCWLKTITRTYRKTIHPVRHLLFITFLGEKIDTFYSNSNKTYQPFGPPPYPCLNTASEHFKQKVIPEVQITTCSKTRRPVGTFKCSCGFVYSRKGPDLIVEDLYRVGRIKEFGSVWKQKLHELIHKNNMSYYVAAKQLRVDIATVKKYASQKHRTLAVTEKEANEKLLEAKRKRWKKLKEKFPKSSASQLRREDPALYTWLYRNDKEWLLSHKPKVRKKFKRTKRVDWETRDDQTVLDAIKATVNLLNQEKPERISVTRIGLEINKVSLLQKKLNLMPRTKFFLYDIADTVEQFQIRRVQWAARVLYKSNHEVVPWRICKLAGLGKNIHPTVQEEIRKQVEKYSLNN